MNLTDAIGDWARRAPGVPALVADDRSLDRARLEAAAGAAAAALAVAGLARGDPVAVVPGPDPFLHVVVTLALARLGLVHIPFRPGEPPARRAAVCRALGARALVTDAPAAAEALRVIRPEPAWLDARPPAAAAAAADVPAVPWVIAHSSGSTGAPKAIAVTHAMELARNRRDRQHFQHRPGEPYLTLIGPGFYNSTSSTIRCLGHGGTVVLGRPFRTLGEVLGTIERHRVAFLQLTPSHLHQIVHALPDGPPRLPGLRVLRVSSAALPARTLELTRRRLTPAVHLTYGTNEAGTLAVATPDLLARHPGTVGRWLADIEIDLVGPDDHPVADGVPGLVRVRGPGVMDAYLGDADATARHCRGGWFHPGDLALRDAAGLVFLKGRSDRVMNVAGVLRASEEIEAILLAHPDVAEAAVVPLASDRFEAMPAAAVVLLAPVAREALAGRVHQALGGLPLLVVPVDALPRTAIGKPDYPRIAELVAAQLRPERGT